LPHALCAEVGAPLRFDTVLLGSGVRDRLLRAGGHAHQARPAVGGIGDALDVASAFELVDQSGRRLLRDLRPRGQHAEPGAFGVDAHHEPGLRDGHVVETTFLQCLEDAVSGRSRGDEHKQAGGQFALHQAPSQSPIIEL